MKNTALCLLLMIFCCLNIYGQQKEITHQEYADALMNGYRRSGNTSYRSITKAETFSISDGKLIKTATSIFEFLPTDKRRYYAIEMIDGVNEKLEVIRIGSIEYQRIDDGEWTKKDFEWITATTVGGAFEIKWVSKYAVTDAVLNKRAVQLYEKDIRHRNGKNFHEKFWIDTEGLILKIESTSRYLNPEKLESRNVTDYEYNPKDLKIEAPIKP